MAYQSLLIQEQIFAIDIGATNIKFSHVNELGDTGARGAPTSDALSLLARATGRVPRRAHREAAGAAG